MNRARKKAPNYKKQPKGALNAVIFAGADAWNLSKAYEQTPNYLTDDMQQLENALPSNRAETNAPPIVIANEQLAEIASLSIVPNSAQAVTIYRANTPEQLKNGGGLSSMQITALCANLASNSNVISAELYNEQGELIESLGDYIKRLRNDKDAQQLAEIATDRAQAQAMNDETGETHRPTLSANPSEQELTRAFLYWHKNPLGRDTQHAQTLEFNGIFWQAVNDEMLERKIVEFSQEIEHELTDRKISVIARYSKRLMELVEPQSPDIIGFQNGVIHKLTGEFKPHHRTHNLRAVEPYECQPNRTETPLFNRWLDTVTQGNEDKRNALLAGLYMILTNSSEWHLFLEITGIAGSGKSVCAEIATLINGDQNTGIITLKDMEDPAKLSGLLNKSLAYSPDQGYYKGDGNFLKRLSGSDPTTIKFLYADPFSVKLSVVFMMTTNEAMLFTDRNGGIARRRVIIPFTHAIPPKERDINFTDKVRLEVYGIINKLLALYPPQLDEQGKLKGNEKARLILEAYREKNEGKEIKRNGNHLIDFCSYFTVSDTAPRSKTLRLGSARNLYLEKDKADTLYTAYALYCECIDNRRLPLLAFKNALADAFKDTGEATKLRISTYNGYLATNAQWRDKENALREWGAI